VASVLVVELELVLVLGPGLAMVVVVEDMGEVVDITCLGVGFRRLLLSESRVTDSDSNQIWADLTAVISSDQNLLLRK
jgi:hypothetical protein